MKILAFAGTNSKKSITTELLEYVLSKFESDEIDLINLNDYEMPIYNIDLERAQGLPDEALRFAQKVDDCDVIIMSLAEHNGTYTVAFKNVFDWMSRVPDRPHWGNKEIFVMATSFGKRGGMGVLKAAVERFPFNDGKIIGSFSLPCFKENFDPKLGIINEEKAAELDDKIGAIKDLRIKKYQQYKIK